MQNALGKVTVDKFRPIENNGSNIVPLTFALYLPQGTGHYQLEDLPENCQIQPGDKLDIYEERLLQTHSGELPASDALRIRAQACLGCRFMNLPLGKEGCPRYFRER